MTFVQYLIERLSSECDPLNMERVRIGDNSCETQLDEGRRESARRAIAHRGIHFIYAHRIFVPNRAPPPSLPFLPFPL